MEKLVGREEAERIVSLVCRIAFGEGYTLDELANLLSLSRPYRRRNASRDSRELASKGLMKRREAPSIELSNREVLRCARKLVSTE
ncbi:MAG: hypothetical protein GXO32_00365 [Crenarchaeota archaeon]|nr:hypothetical protein [Thermoproteota archaeon]